MGETSEAYSEFRRATTFLRERHYNAHNGDMGPAGRGQQVGVRWHASHSSIWQTNQGVLIDEPWDPVRFQRARGW